MSLTSSNIQLTNKYKPAGCSNNKVKLHVQRFIKEREKDESITLESDTLSINEMNLRKKQIQKVIKSYKKIDNTHEKCCEALKILKRRGRRRKKNSTKIRLRNIDEAVQTDLHIDTGIPVVESPECHEDFREFYAIYEIVTPKVYDNRLELQQMLQESSKIFADELIKWCLEDLKTECIWEQKRCILDLVQDIKMNHEINEILNKPIIKEITIGEIHPELTQEFSLVYEREEFLPVPPDEDEPSKRLAVKKNIVKSTQTLLTAETSMKSAEDATEKILSDAKFSLFNRYCRYR